MVIFHVHRSSFEQFGCEWKANTRRRSRGSATVARGWPPRRLASGESLLRDWAQVAWPAQKVVAVRLEAKRRSAQGVEGLDMALSSGGGARGPKERG